LSEASPFDLILVVFTGLAFVAYGVGCLTSAKMKRDFKRFGLERFSVLTGVLEILGGVGLLVGLFAPAIFLLSSGGLAVLMLLGLIFRIRVGDGFVAAFPAAVFLLINGYLFLRFVG
jgi:uncharacterized membrane protein YphA (DoxX/SURF4 family)